MIATSLGRCAGLDPARLAQQQFDCHAHGAWRRPRKPRSFCGCTWASAICCALSASNRRLTPSLCSSRQYFLVLLAGDQVAAVPDIDAQGMAGAVPAVAATVISVCIRAV